MIVRQNAPIVLFAKMVGAIGSTAVLLALCRIATEPPSESQLGSFLLSAFVAIEFSTGFNGFPHLKVHDHYLSVSFYEFFWLTIPWSKIRSISEQRLPGVKAPIYKVVLWRSLPPWYYLMAGQLSPLFYIVADGEKPQEAVKLIKEHAKTNPI